MKKSKYFAQLNENKDAIRSFVSAFHPSSRTISRRPMKITAPKAEAACESVRKEIQATHQSKSVLERFDEALENKDHAAIDLILNEAWFGVPESTECWKIPGFREAVQLTEDPISS